MFGLLSERGEEMTKHTKGPWEVREVEGLFAFASEKGFVMENSDEQNRIDARLIAAAPELLAACKAMVAAKHMGDAIEAWEAAEAAIAKAEGGA